MADGPAIYPQSYYGTSPLDRFVTGAVEGYGKAIDFQAKSDALSMQLLSNAKLRQAAADRAAKEKGADGSTSGEGDYSGGGDQSPAGTAGTAGTAGGGTAGGDIKLVDGTTDFENAETRMHNYGGMRKPGVYAGPSAGGFQQFATPEAFVQAASNQIDRYAAGKTTGTPLTTIRQIVSTWAPPSDSNNTNSMIANTSKVLGGIDPDTPLNLADPTVKAGMVESLVRAEQGGMLHSRVAAAIPKVFSLPNYQPYSSKPQQAAIGGTSAAQSAGTQSAGTQSAGASLSLSPASTYVPVPYYNPNTLMPGSAPAALSGTMPAGASGQQTYAAPPQPPPVNYAALVQPQYALAPSSSGLFG